MVRAALVAATLAMVPLPAHAERVGDGGLVATMDDLRILCNASIGSAAHSVCAGYILGAANAILNKSRIDELPAPFCFPSVYSDAMVVDAVRVHMFNNDQQRTLAASMTTFVYLRLAFPCERPNGK